MLFYYKAKKLTGEEIDGDKEAADEYSLARALKEQDFILTYFIPKESKENKNWFSFLAPVINMLTFKNVPISEKMNFARNLAVMIEAGISLSRGLETLSRQTKNKALKECLKSISEEIKTGKSFHESLKSYPKIFPLIFSAMVKSGEKTGNLNESLKILSEQLKKDYELRKRIKGAMTYPIIVLIAMFIIGAIMMVYVVPTLVANFKELNAELPATTKFFIKTSDLIVNHGFYTLVGLISLIAASMYARSLPQFKKFFNMAVLKIPLIAPLAKKANTARTARTLGSLIGSGVNILEALEVTEEVLQNVYYKSVINEAKLKIEKGEQISKIFMAHPNLYPPVMSEMTAVGEETGKIADMLLQIAGFYENEVANETKDLSTIIEPILMIFIGAAVGLFAISMLQPMYGMMQNV